MAKRRGTPILTATQRDGIARIIHRVDNNHKTTEPPKRIQYTTRSPWTDRETGKTWWHVQVVEMRLDHETPTGPQYVTTKVIADTGAPPRNPRSAPTAMGVAWFALQEQIDRGYIIPIAVQQGEP
jgi:hypothetical protein